jgi:hypothetical protein
MVQRLIKIPKHGGPDGVGLTPSIFQSLVQLVSDRTITDKEATSAIELCLGASTQAEWNDIYRPQLIEILQRNVII